MPAAPGNLIPLAPVANGEWVGQFSSSTQPADAVRFRPDDVRPGALSSALTRVWDRISLRAEDFTRRKTSTGARSTAWRSRAGFIGWRETRRAAPSCISTAGPRHTARTRSTMRSSSSSKRASRSWTRTIAAVRASDWSFARRSGDGLGWIGAGGHPRGHRGTDRRGHCHAGQVGVTGTSYGGYSSWHAITHFSKDIVAAAAPICGMTDLVIDYETTRPDLRPYSEEMIGGSPATAPERYRERSPIHFVGHIRGRMLIVQGLQDPNVTPENVRAVEVALRDAGIPTSCWRSRMRGTASRDRRTSESSTPGCPSSSARCNRSCGQR